MGDFDAVEVTTGLISTLLPTTALPLTPEKYRIKYSLLLYICLTIILKSRAVLFVHDVDLSFLI